MVVIVEAPLVDDDMGTPVRKRTRIQLDLITEEDDPPVRQGDHTTKASGIVIRLRVSGREARAVCQARAR
jgi:hypothetical protein